MANPLDDESLNEYIEIYNNGSEAVNISGWVIGDDKDNDTIEGGLYGGSGTIIQSFNYGIITDDMTRVYNNFNVSEYAIKLYIDDASIGYSGLNNNDDSIYLYDNNISLIDSFNYSSTTEGLSWTRVGNNWIEDQPTPGGNGTISIIVIEDQNINYDVLKINEFLPNPEGDDDAPIPDGEWVELYNSGDEPINVEGLILNDDFGNGLEITEVNVINSTIISAHSFLTVYRNGNGKLELNNDGYDLVILSYEGIVIDSVSYSGSIEGSSFAKVNEIWQQTKPTPGSTNINYSGVKDSVFDIEKIYDLGRYNRAKFGQTIRAKVNIWKGDDTKNSISLWVEDEDGHRISKYSKTSIYTRYTNHELALPVQLYPNCDENYDDGNYTLYIGWTSGYEVKDSYNFSIRGISKDLCIAYKEIEQEKLKKFVYELVSKPNKIETGKEFEVKVKLINNDNNIHKIEIWSYVYRGPKCYSGDRDENKKELTLPRNDEIIETLKNKVEEAEPGDYKLRVMIIKDEQKTPYIITRDISITSPPVEKKTIVKTESKTNIENLDEETGLFLVDIKEDNETDLQSKGSGIIYESTSSAASRLIPYFIIFISLILNIILILRR